jgi:hypothetical protein
VQEQGQGCSIFSESSGDDLDADLLQHFSATARHGRPRRDQAPQQAPQQQGRARQQQSQARQQPGQAPRRLRASVKQEEELLMLDPKRAKRILANRQVTCSACPPAFGLAWRVPAPGPASVGGQLAGRRRRRRRLRGAAGWGGRVCAGAAALLTRRPSALPACPQSASKSKERRMKHTEELEHKVRLGSCHKAAAWL